MLQKAIASNHHLHQNDLFVELTKKIPDLRTLNALHSEKLLGKSFGVLESTAAVTSNNNNSQESNLRMADGSVHRSQQQQQQNINHFNQPLTGRQNEILSSNEENGNLNDYYDWHKTKSVTLQAVIIKKLEVAKEKTIFCLQDKKIQDIFNGNGQHQTLILLTGNSMDQASKNTTTNASSSSSSSSSSP